MYVHIYTWHCSSAAVSEALSGGVDYSSECDSGRVRNVASRSCGVLALLIQSRSSQLQAALDRFHNVLCCQQLPFGRSSKYM